MGVQCEGYRFSRWRRRPPIHGQRRARIRQNRARSGIRDALKRCPFRQSVRYAAGCASPMLRPVVHIPRREAAKIASATFANATSSSSNEKPVFDHDGLRIGNDVPVDVEMTIFQRRLIRDRMGPCGARETRLTASSQGKEQGIIAERWQAGGVAAKRLRQPVIEPAGQRIRIHRPAAKAGLGAPSAIRRVSTK